MRKSNKENTLLPRKQNKELVRSPLRSPLLSRTKSAQKQKLAQEKSVSIEPPSRQEEQPRKGVLKSLINSIILQDGKSSRHSDLGRAASRHSFTSRRENGTQNKKKLPLHELCKLTQEIYAANFTRNTMRLRSKQLCGGGGDQQNKLADFLQAFFANPQRKKKGQTLSLLLESLAFHLSKGQYTNLVIFDKFIAEEYTSEDLLFFLFLRCIAEKELRLSLAKEFEGKKQARSELELVFLSKKQVLRIAKAVFGAEDLSKAYIQAIFKFMDDSLQEKIGLYRFMLVFLNEYHRLKSIKASLPDEQQAAGPPPPPTPEPLPLEQTESAYEFESEEDRFWSLNTGDLSLLRREHVEQMRETLLQFMAHLAIDLTKHKLLFDRLLAKSLHLLACTMSSDKLEWFNSLDCAEPSEEELSEVEEIQRSYLRDGGRVYKKILGVRRVREKVVSALSAS